MKKYTLILILFYSLQVFGQENRLFLLLEGSTVYDSIVKIPNSTKGKYTLIGLAYSKKAEDNLATWFEPVFQKFIQSKLTKNTFNAFAYDVNVYFIPMFTGLNAPVTGLAKKKTIKNIDERLHDFIVFYKGDLKTYKSELNLDKKDTPYFFVLNEKGEILYRTNGTYSEDKMDEIAGILE